MRRFLFASISALVLAGAPAKAATLSIVLDVEGANLTALDNGLLDLNKTANVIFVNDTFDGVQFMGIATASDHGDVLTLSNVEFINNSGRMVPASLTARDGMDTIRIGEALSPFETIAAPGVFTAASNVPEPSTWAMLICGFALCAWARFKRSARCVEV